MLLSVRDDDWSTTNSIDCRFPITTVSLICHVLDINRGFLIKLGSGINEPIKRAPIVLQGWLLWLANRLLLIRSKDCLLSERRGLNRWIDRIVDIHLLTPTTGLRTWLLTLILCFDTGLQVFALLVLHPAIKSLQDLWLDRKVFDDGYAVVITKLMGKDRPVLKRHSVLLVGLNHDYSRGM